MPRASSPTYSVVPGSVLASRQPLGPAGPCARGGVGGHVGDGVVAVLVLAAASPSRVVAGAVGRAPAQGLVGGAEAGVRGCSSSGERHARRRSSRRCPKACGGPWPKKRPGYRLQRLRCGWDAQARRRPGGADGGRHQREGGARALGQPQSADLDVRILTSVVSPRARRGARRGRAANCCSSAPSARFQRVPKAMARVQAHVGQPWWTDPAERDAGLSRPTGTPTRVLARRQRAIARTRRVLRAAQRGASSSLAASQPAAAAAWT